MKILAPVFSKSELENLEANNWLLTSRSWSTDSSSGLYCYIFVSFSVAFSHPCIRLVNWIQEFLPFLISVEQPIVTRFPFLRFIPGSVFYRLGGFLGEPGRSEGSPVWRSFCAWGLVFSWLCWALDVHACIYVFRILRFYVTIYLIYACILIIGLKVHQGLINAINQSMYFCSRERVAQRMNYR